MSAHALSLLVVDDDDVDRERVIRLLNRSPWTVDAMQASSGAEALRLVQCHPFDCVVLDNQLGDTSGADLLPALHQHAMRDCPVIMVTGAGDESLAVRLLHEGAADYLPKKSLNADALVQAIVDSRQRYELLRQRNQTQQLLERDLKALLDNMPAMIGYWDAALRSRFANRAYCEACGLPEGGMAGMTLRQALGEVQFRAIEAHAACALGGQEQAFELFAPTPDHGARYLHSHLIPDRDAGGSVMGFYLLQTDITAMKVAQAELAAARDAAYAAALSKSAFLANMSHEVRTPMNAIVGLSRLALEEDLGQRARDHVQRVHGAAMALTGVLDDVLDYSRIESGQLRFENIEFDVMDVLQRAADLFAVKIAQSGLEFAIDVAPGVPRRLVGDPLRISQVLHNLIGNAAKFTEQGEIEVRVGGAADASAGRYRLRVSIRDTGVGVPKAQLAGLFEAFAQADSSITRRFGGSGLGLAICKRLVERMDGEVRADSQPGRGSEFTFEISLGVGSVVAGDTALQDLRVLLIDSNAPRLRALKAELEALGATVVCAAGASAAIRRLKKARGDPHAGFALALLGWDAVGNADPLELMLALRDAGNVRSVAAHLSALGADGIPAVGHPLRPDAVLPRPLLAKALRDGILRALGGHQTPEAAQPASLQALRFLAEPIHGARVLVVEDNEVNQIVAAQLLERLGLQVTIAGDGADAAAAVREAGPHGFAAVLMDLHMPRVDGFEATRRILALPNTSTLPVIAMSAAVLEQDRADALAAGMVDHVAKPLVAERLLEVLLARIAHDVGESAGAAARPRLTVLSDFVRREARTVEEIARLLAGGHLGEAALHLRRFKFDAGAAGAEAILRDCEQLEAMIQRGSVPDEALRSFTAVLNDISFDTGCGAAPH